MICPRCNEIMNNTMHFEQDRKFQYKKCPRCYEKTRPKRVHFEDILEKAKQDKIKRRD